ncbi:hypothetical protein M2150_001662 [Lachnospiraceae bacterium PM6-15]|uniref:hypothetical protein n=1 Tax=Ohessyouella blattaphilus TaxID=2949333 RepID=UPI003E204C94
MKNALKKVVSIALVGTMVFAMAGCAKSTDAKEETVKEVAKKIEMKMTGKQVTVVAKEKVSTTKFVKEVNVKKATLDLKVTESADTIALTPDKKTTVEHDKKNVPQFEVSFDKVGKATVEAVATLDGYKEAKGTIKVVVADEIAKYAKGLTDNVNVLEGTEGLDLVKDIEFDKTKIKSIKVDDSKVNYKKAGTYDVVYIITTADDKKIDVPVQVIVVDKDTAKDLANNGETVKSGNDKTVEKTEDKKEDKKEDSKTEDKKEDSSSKDTSKDNSKDTSKDSSKGNDKTANTDNANIGSGGNTNPSTSDPNAGKTKVWIVDVPARAEQGHYDTRIITPAWTEQVQTGSYVYCVSCGSSFSNTSEWSAHAEASGRGGCSQYSVEPTYSSVVHPAVTEQVWVVDSPAQAEQGHWEWR